MGHINQEERNNEWDTLNTRAAGTQAPNEFLTVQAVDPNAPDIHFQRFVSATEKLLQEESIRRGESDSCLQDSLAARCDLYHTLMVGAYVKDLSGSPDPERLALGLLSASKDLAWYAMAYIAEQENPRWSGVVTMLQRWHENGITTVDEAKRDYERRKDQAKESRKPMTIAGFQAYVRKAIAGGATYEEFSAWDEQRPTWQFVETLTIKRRKEIIQELFGEAGVRTQTT